MQQNQTNNRSAIVIIAILFFIFGFVTWLNGPLKLKKAIPNEITLNSDDYISFM